tara:strand:- start:61 stop:543 length:483 start_codon:yes stop_codon:yes gene_type:complete
MKLFLATLLVNCIYVYSKNCNNNFGYCLEKYGCPINKNNEFALPYKIDSDTCKRYQYNYDNKITDGFPTYLLNSWSPNNCCSAGGETFWKIIELVNECHTSESFRGYDDHLRIYTHREKCRELIDMYSKNNKIESIKKIENIIYSIILLALTFKVLIIFK